MVQNDNPIPKMVTPGYARKHLIKVGKTKFYAMVKAGSIRLVDVGVGRRMVDVASIEAMLERPAQAFGSGLAPAVTREQTPTRRRAAARNGQASALVTA